MTVKEILLQRQHKQLLLSPTGKGPANVVYQMGAMQAQEYAMAKWSIGLRLKEASDNLVEMAFNEGKILRTHVLRPTWHFVAPEDIRWMLALSAPRVRAANAFMYRKEQLDEKVFTKAMKVMEKSLAKKQFPTRDELNLDFEKAGIIATGHRLSYIMMEAELEGLICSGPRQGKQFTYALLDQRVPAAKNISAQEALAGLTLRYFSSRGPATVNDYATWSGLTLKDARNGIATLPGSFITETFNDDAYIFKPSKVTDTLRSFLMPDYDEYGMGYKDRSALSYHPKTSEARVSGISSFNRMLVIDGQIQGTWNRTIKGKHIEVDIYPFYKLNKTKQEKVDKAVAEFSRFSGK